MMVSVFSNKAFLIKKKKRNEVENGGLSELQTIQKWTSTKS